MRNQILAATAGISRSSEWLAIPTGIAMILPSKAVKEGKPESPMPACVFA
jgi:hypothetical protein